jgi:hypothetical protein
MGARHISHRSDPAAALRRIGKLEADRRRVQRSRARCTPGSDYARELDRQLAEVNDLLDHWRVVLARHEAEGFKVWSREDFTKGDFVQYRGTWYEVLRVNPKSVTIPHIFNSARRNVVRGNEGCPDGTWTAGYADGITGRMSPEEMRVHLAAPASKKGDQS